MVQVGQPQWPLVYQVFIDYWEVPRALASALWSALARARWSRAQAFRHTVLYYSTDAYVDRLALIRGAFAPQAVVEVLEDLAKEGAFTRAQATAVQERLFICITPGGAWR